jgi:hypothetical protein
MVDRALPSWLPTDRSEELPKDKKAAIRATTKENR